MELKNNPKNILLGKGVYKIDDQLIGLTRDGGLFTLEYVYRNIEADGDRGPVKGRISKDRAVPKLEINHLELLTSFENKHPGITVDTTSKVGYTIIKGRPNIDDEKDYHKVSFEGETKDGREVKITVERAINLENLSFELKDKNEVIDKVTFTGCYEENATTEDEGWSIEYKTQA